MGSLIGLHFVPFALGQLVEKFTGKQPSTRSSSSSDARPCGARCATW
jgi:hypothetical protein